MLKRTMPHIIYITFYYIYITFILHLYYICLPAILWSADHSLYANWLTNLPAVHCHLSLHLIFTGPSSDEVHKR